MLCRKWYHYESIEYFSRNFRLPMAVLWRSWRSSTKTACKRGLPARSGRRCWTPRAPPTRSRSHSSWRHSKTPCRSSTAWSPLCSATPTTGPITRKVTEGYAGGVDNCWAVMTKQRSSRVLRRWFSICYIKSTITFHQIKLYSSLWWSIYVSLKDKCMW